MMNYKRAFYMVLVLLVLTLTQTFTTADTYPAIGTFTPAIDVSIKSGGCFNMPGECLEVGILPAGQMAIVYWYVSYKGVNWAAIDPHQTQWAAMSVNGYCPYVEFGNVRINRP